MDGIHHIALRVGDCKASARFYELVFGLREIRRFEDGEETRSVWLRAGSGATLMLERSIRGRGSAEGSGHVLVFETADLEGAEERLSGLGIVITDRTASTIFFADPDGHRVGLSTYALPDAPVVG